MRGNLGLWMTAAAMSVCVGLASPVLALDRIPDLGGRWSGPGLDLFIDPTHLQGNADPTRPFNRESFFIRNVTGALVVFVIGPEVFFARMETPDTMVVSRGGRIETYTLKRLKQR